MAKRQCEICKQPFVKRRSESQPTWERRRFCSLSCGYKGKRAGPRPTPLADRFWKHVQRAGPDQCWLWTGAQTKNGYGNVTLAPEQNGYAHRIAYQLHYGATLSGEMVLHTCDVRTCVNPAHLYLGNHQQNMQDVAERGTQRGERNPGSRLTEAQVRAIKGLLAVGSDGSPERRLTQQQIADIFKCDRGTINLIARGKTWKHVTLASTTKNDDS